jgi:hypothetical protein
LLTPGYYLSPLRGCKKYAALGDSPAKAALQSRNQELLKWSCGSRDTLQPMKRNPDSESSYWRSRGYIPHCDRKIQLITMRLHDAVPESLIKQWKIELKWLGKMPESEPRNMELRFEENTTFLEILHGT